MYIPRPLILAQPKQANFWQRMAKKAPPLFRWNTRCKLHNWSFTSSGVACGWDVGQDYFMSCSPRGRSCYCASKTVGHYNHVYRDIYNYARAKARELGTEQEQYAFAKYADDILTQMDTWIEKIIVFDCQLNEWEQNGGDLGSNSRPEVIREAQQLCEHAKTQFDNLHGSLQKTCELSGQAAALLRVSQTNITAQKTLALDTGRSQALTSFTDLLDQSRAIAESTDFVHQQIKGN